MTYSKQTCLIKKRHKPASEKKKKVFPPAYYILFSQIATYFIK